MLTRLPIERLERRQLCAAGERDWGFGSAGSIGFPYNGGITPPGGMSVDCRMRPDGKFLALYDSSSETDWCVALLEPRGGTDPTFGVNGAVVTDFGGFADRPARIELLADGRFVVAGTATGKTGRRHYAVARYLANGALDTSFGSGGKVVVDAGVSASVTDLYLLDGGTKILFGGGTRLIRLNANGSPDVTFGGGDGIASAAALDGFALQGAAAIVTFSQIDGEARVYRYHAADGSPDPSFGTAGVATALSGILTHEFIDTGDIAVNVDDMILLSTTTADLTAPIGSEERYALVRLNSDGSLDDTFGVAGVAHCDITGYARRIVIQRDGKVIQNGYSTTVHDIARYNTDGTRDLTFGPYADGYAIQTFASNVALTAGEYERIMVCGSNYVMILSSDTSPRVPQTFHYRDYSIDIENKILTIRGGDGDDVIRVFDEADSFGFIINDADESRYFGDTEIRQIIIEGGAGNDVIVVGGGYGYGVLPPTYISGGDGNDTLIGSDAPDTISGNAGKDYVDGGGGNDRLAGNGGHDNVVGNVGYDRLYGDAGNDKLEAGSGNDRVYGGENDDLMSGGAGTDSLYGGNGTDTIVGGGGTDRAFDVTALDLTLGISTITWAQPATQTATAPAPLPPPRTVDELADLLA